MRITQILFRINKYRYYNELWQKRRSVKSVKDMGIPQFIIDKNIPVYDAVTFASQNEPVDLSKFFSANPSRRQSQWAYMIGHKTRLLEGPVQAQILTNSIAHGKLPQEYQDAFNSMSITEDEIKWLDHRLKMTILDSKQFKLPHKADPKRPWYIYARDFGPGVERHTAEVLSCFNDFVRLRNSQQKSDAAYKPLIHELSCQYIGAPKPNPDGTPGVNPYVYQGYASSVTITSSPLNVLTSSESSNAFGPTGGLPSLYPASPEMDLSKKFDYEPRTICPILPLTTTKDDASGSMVSLHTLFITHPWDNDGWKPSEKLGRAILQSFTFAAAQTVDRLGETSPDTKWKNLPVPDRIRLQTIYHDLDTVGFIVYHLNTLSPGWDGAPEGEIRNELYHECVSLRENDELNPRVLQWLKVFHEA